VNQEIYNGDRLTQSDNRFVLFIHPQLGYFQWLNYPKVGGSLEVGMLEFQHGGER